MCDRSRGSTSSLTFGAVHVILALLVAVSHYDFNLLLLKSIIFLLTVYILL